MGEAARRYEPSDVSVAPRVEREDQVVLLEGATWADYQRLLELRGERSVPRLTYLEGRLELMSPSRQHEAIKSTIGCLIEAWCLARNVDISPYGSWTLEAKEAERGLEPDECYVVGDDPEPARPDLAIEVVWSSGRLDKLDVYRKLGVQEVWYWRRGVGRLELFALRDEAYEPIDQSEVLAGIDHAELARFIEVRPTTRAIRAYRAALEDA